MASIPLKSPTQIERFGNSHINRALTDVAQKVAGLLQQAYPSQTGSIYCAETIAIRAIEPEYRQAMMIEPLTARELEVLQLMVDGYSNRDIAGKLYIAVSTVKTHVRTILKKIYVNDAPRGLPVRARTQAAIRALRFGLVS